MKVWQKIILGKQYGIKAWNLDTTESELSAYNCPARIEAEHGFVGIKRLERFCQLGCGVKCLREYLELEVPK